MKCFTFAALAVALLLAFASSPSYAEGRYGSHPGQSSDGAAVVCVFNAGELVGVVYYPAETDNAAASDGCRSD